VTNRVKRFLAYDFWNNAKFTLFVAKKTKMVPKFSVDWEYYKYNAHILRNGGPGLSSDHAQKKVN
jgi:hypothetical protein